MRATWVDVSLVGGSGNKDDAGVNSSFPNMPLGSLRCDLYGGEKFEGKGNTYPFPSNFSPP